MLWSILNLISVLSCDGCSFIQNLSYHLPLVSPFLKGRVVYAVCFGCRLSMLLPDLLTDLLTPFFLLLVTLSRSGSCHVPSFYHCHFTSTGIVAVYPFGAGIIFLILAHPVYKI